MCSTHWDRAAQVTPQLTTLMTMLTLESVTGASKTTLQQRNSLCYRSSGTPAPQYQIEVRLGPPAGLPLPELGAALRHAQGLLFGGFTYL